MNLQKIDEKLFNFGYVDMFDKEQTLNCIFVQDS